MSHDAHGAQPSRPSPQFPLFGRDANVPAETPAAPSHPVSHHPNGPKLYPVPPLGSGTRQARCTGKHCDAVVFWTPGVRFPISCSYDGCTSPTATDPGLGVSHFVDCPDSQAFSGRNREATRGR
jgi:hypothetical protein